MAFFYCYECFFKYSVGDIPCRAFNADYQLYKWLKVGTNTSIEIWSSGSISHKSAYGSMLAPTLLLDPTDYCLLG